MAKQIENLSGRKFGRLTVSDLSTKVSKNGTRYWSCICECGNFIETKSTRLKDGSTTSCGCIRKGLAKTHGQSCHGAGTKTWRAWSSMRDRIHNPNHPFYHRYGGRGLTIDSRWDSFETFLEDMGEAPKGLSLERENNELGYTKDNCKWATQKEQSRNRSNSVFYTIDGITKNLSAWCEIYRSKYSTVRYRLSIGKTIEEALDLC